MPSEIAKIAAMQQPQQQQQTNPFDLPILRAIQSARASLSQRTPEQEMERSNKKIGAAVNNFGSALSQAKPSPTGRNMWGNIAGNVGGALGAGINGYNTAEEQMQTHDEEEAKEILRLYADEQERQARQEDKDWQHNFYNRQLSGTEENNRSNRDLHNRQIALQEGELDLKRQYYGNKSKADAEMEKNKSNDEAWKIAVKHNTTKLIPEIYDKYDANLKGYSDLILLKNTLAESKLSGGSPIAGFKRTVARITGNDESVVTADNAGQIFIEWMNKNNKGAMSNEDAERFLATLPNINKNPKASVAILDRMLNRIHDHQLVYDQQLDAYKNDPGTNISAIRLPNNSKAIPVNQTPLNSFRTNETSVPNKPMMDVFQQPISQEEQDAFDQEAKDLGL